MKKHKYVVLLNVRVEVEAAFEGDARMLALRTISKSEGVETVTAEVAQVERRLTMEEIRRQSHATEAEHERP